MEIYIDSGMGMSDWVSCKQYPPQTLIYKDVPANTECWVCACTGHFVMVPLNLKCLH